MCCVFEFEYFGTDVIFLGLKKATNDEIQAERDEQMRLNYHDPVERFLEKMDQTTI